MNGHVVGEILRLGKSSGWHRLGVTQIQVILDHTLKGLPVAFLGDGTFVRIEELQGKSIRVTKLRSIRLLGSVCLE